MSKIENGESRPNAERALGVAGAGSKAVKAASEFEQMYRDLSGGRVMPLRAAGSNDEVHAHAHEWGEDGTCRFCPVHKPSMDALRGLIDAIEREERKAEAPVALPSAPEHPLRWRWRLRAAAREAVRWVRWHHIVRRGRWDLWRGKRG